MAMAGTWLKRSGPPPGASQDSTMRVEANPASAGPATRNAANWMRLPDISALLSVRFFKAWTSPAWTSTTSGTREDRNRVPGWKLDLGPTGDEGPRQRGPGACGTRFCFFGRVGSYGV